MRGIKKNFASQRGLLMYNDYLSMDEKLFRDRTIVIEGYVQAQHVAKIVMSLLQFDADDNKEDIQIILALDGIGYLDAMAIYDTMTIIKSPISIICMGHLQGDGVILLAGATKGMRRVLKHTEIYLSQTYGHLGAGASQQTEITIAAKEATEQRKVLEEILVEATGQPAAKIHADCEEGIRLKAEEALAYGIIDEIIA